MRPSFLGNKVRICDVCGEEAIGNFRLDPHIHFTCSRCVQRRLMAHKNNQNNQEIELEELREAIRNKKLRHYRQIKGWTLRDLARKLGIDYTYLSLVENHRRKPTEKWLSDLEVKDKVKVGDSPQPLASSGE